MIWLSSYNCSHDIITDFGYSMFYGPKLKPQKGGEAGFEAWIRIKVITEDHLGDELGSSVWLRWQRDVRLQDCQYKNPDW